MWLTKDMKGQKILRVEFQAAPGCDPGCAPTYAGEVCVWFEDGSALRMTPVLDPKIGRNPYIQVHGKTKGLPASTLPTARDRYAEFLESESKGGERVVCPVGCGICCSSLEYSCVKLGENGCLLDPKDRPDTCNEYLCEAAKRVVELEGK